MNRQTLINYSYYCSGDYFKMIRAINEGIKVPSVSFQNCITIFDDIYPKEFLNLRHPPLVLYYEGDLSLLKERKIGVVGSRKACEYAIEATKRLVLNNPDKVIVSGLAKGIDAVSHEYAMKTIGILGSGIDYYYPRENMELIKRIKKEGLVLSEYPRLTRPLAYHFPFRNRLIAALSDTLYVMQSTCNSGTMTSINEALELGKNVKVLPYDIFNEYGENNNHLIKEGADIIEREEIAF